MKTWPNKQTGKVLYRYQNFNESIGGYDESGEYRSYGHNVRLRIIKIPILKETEKGYWIQSSTGKQVKTKTWLGENLDMYVSFVLKGSGKRLAHETIELAKESFIARKKRQIKLLSKQLEDAEKALKLINETI